MSDARTHRVTFYLNDEEQTVLEQVLSESGKERAGYFRDLLVGDSRSTESDTENGTGAESSKVMQVLEDALADTRQSKDRLEQLLLQANTTVSDLTRALPAPASLSEAVARPWWRVWG